MISLNGLEYIKSMCETQADMIPGGVLYLITKRDTFIWRKASAQFDLDIFQLGEKLSAQSIIGRAMREGKTLISNVPRSLYGIRLKTIAEPIVDDEGQVVGGFSTVFPVLHPVVKAFDDFAPILSNMFADGVVLFTTDLNKFIGVQNSREFQLPHLKVGNDFTEDSPAANVIKSQKPFSKEFDNSIYDKPCLAVCYPLFSDEEEIVATIGLVIPKVAAASLREISVCLESGLTQISASIEELHRQQAFVKMSRI